MKPKHHNAVLHASQTGPIEYSNIMETTLSTESAKIDRGENGSV